MSRSPRNTSGAPPIIITLMLCVTMITLAARWAFRPVQRDDSSANAVHGAVITATPDVEKFDQSAFPIRVLAVSLNDDLFPEAAPEREPTAPMAVRLEIDLVAITNVDGVRGIFAYDRTAKEYFTAAAGDATPSGAMIVAIEEEAVLFEVSGNQARLELTP